MDIDILSIVRTLLLVATVFVILSFLSILYIILWLALGFLYFIILNNNKDVRRQMIEKPFPLWLFAVCFSFQGLYNYYTDRKLLIRLFRERFNI